MICSILPLSAPGIFCAIGIFIFNFPIAPRWGWAVRGVLRMETSQPFKTVKYKKLAPYYSIQIGRIAGQATKTIVVHRQGDSGLIGPKRDAD